MGARGPSWRSQDNGDVNWHWSDQKRLQKIHMGIMTHPSLLLVPFTAVSVRFKAVNTHQHWQVDQEMGVPGVNTMLCQVARHQVVHDEVEGGQLPVVVPHRQVPQFSEGELTVVEGVCEEENAARHEGDWNYCSNPEVEDLEWGEH